VQVTGGAGADSPNAFTTAARWQVDLSPRTALVASGLYRGEADEEAQNAAAGLALGIAPFSRLTLWTQGDVRFRDGTDGTENAYTVVGDASIEAYRGVWLRLTAQLETEFDDSSAGTLRYGLGINWLPRTHWNLIFNWYHDKNRETDFATDTLLAQLHFYL
jgi:hypothetical protein